jgi:hypothetical protein
VAAWRAADPAARRILAAYLVLWTALFAYAGASWISSYRLDELFDSEFNKALLVFLIEWTLLVAVPVIALARGRRWGWVLSVAVTPLLVGLSILAADSPEAIAAGFAKVAVELVLLLSPPMRRYVSGIRERNRTPGAPALAA